MSRKLVTLVYERRIGSVHRKAILAYCADRASDNGKGIWASKQTIADETECGRSTVIKIIAEFVAEGILVVAGERPCTNGKTIIYDMNVEAVEALPTTKKPSVTRPPAGLVQNETSPPAGPHPSTSGTSTRPPAGPKPSLEPSLNQEPPSGPPPEKARLPEDWVLHEEGWAYGREMELTDSEIQEIANDFHAYWSDRRDRDSRKSERGWNQTWRNRVRAVAPSFKRNRSFSGAPQSTGYGQGGSLASQAARRRFGS